MPKQLILPRETLKSFLPDPRAVRAFENLLSGLNDALDQLVGVQTRLDALGTMSTQDADAVAITGGGIDGTPVGGTVAAAGRFSYLESTVATGAAPLVVFSTTEVANLRAATATLADLATRATQLATAHTIGGVSFNGTADITVQSATGNFTVGAGFGCNGQAAQTALSLGAAATDLPTAIALVNKIRTALIANGIGTA